MINGYKSDHKNLIKYFLLKSQKCMKNSIPDPLYMRKYVEVGSAPPNLQMELIEFLSIFELKCLHEGNKIEFYQKYILKDKFPNLKRLAMYIISAFGTTYRCELFFSQIKAGKNKVWQQVAR